jgi:acetyltransferase-like isoleucine patch superfamily enzyme
MTRRQFLRHKPKVWRISPIGNSVNTHNQIKPAMTCKSGNRKGEQGMKVIRDHFQHKYAIVEADVTIGRGTRIWAFVHVLPGAVIGSDCNICDQTFIEGGVRIGDRVTIKCGVSLWDGLVVEEDVFIGPNAVFTNDLRPRSGVHPAVYTRTLLKEGCSLGANCTILPGLTIGRWAMIGAGAVVTHDVPDYALVAGVNARLMGWVCRCGNKLTASAGSRWICSCGRTYIKQSGNEMVEK